MNEFRKLMEILADIDESYPGQDAEHEHQRAARLNPASPAAKGKAIVDIRDIFRDLQALRDELDDRAHKELVSGIIKDIITLAGQ